MKISLLIFCFCSIKSFAQFYISPNIVGIGVNFGLVRDNQTPKRNDLKVNNPLARFYQPAKLEIGLVKKKYKVYLELGHKELTKRFKLIVDTVGLPNQPIPKVDIGVFKFISYQNTIYALFGYSKVKYKPKFAKQITIGYGLGVGLNFNKTKYYYEETQEASYFYRGYVFGNSFVNFERFTEPIKNSLFLKLQGAVGLLNKKQREWLTLEGFFHYGLKPMVKNVINYSYGTVGVPSSGKSIRGSTFYNKSTAVGIVFGFPIYFKKIKKVK